MSQNLEKITQLTAQRNTLSARMATLIPSEADWRKDSTLPCTQSLKSKREACQKERANSLLTANQRAAEIASIKDQINSIDRQISVLESTQESSNTANITLAGKGISLESEVLKAEGEARADLALAEAQGTAAQQAAQIKANAEAQAIKESSSVASDNSKQRNMIFIAIAVIAALGIGFFLYKKYN